MRDVKIGFYDVVKSTTLESNKSRADFHAPILTLLFDASNLLFLQGCKSATNFSSFVVDQALA
jgi:hypothetical protein